MNLKDRMKSGSPASKQTETESLPKPNSNDTMQNSNVLPQDSILQKQSELIQQLQAELGKTSAELELLKKQGRSQDQETIQRLLAEKSRLTSMIADLKAEVTAFEGANKKIIEAEIEMKRKSSLYFKLLAFTLVCCSIMNFQVRSDFIDFFVGIYKFLSPYVNWLTGLSEKMSLGAAWFLRILLSLLLLAIVMLAIAGIIALYQLYRERWCPLSRKCLGITLATLCAFGEPIRALIPINLVTLFLLSQIAYLFILWYLDGYSAARSRSDEWKRYQNK